MFDPSDVYRRLFELRGHQSWWPAETPFEVVVGAVLTQNTAWTNVERAIAAIKEAGAMDPFVILSMQHEELAQLVRPTGYYNVKARRLHSLVQFVVEEAGGEVMNLARFGMEDLRRRLLEVNGVGMETADSILLYALEKPVFVVDAYTRRVFGRMGAFDPGRDYDEIRALFESALGRDSALYNDYHAQIVAHGKNVCRPRPLCTTCVLADMCRAAEIDEGARRG